MRTATFTVTFTSVADASATMQQEAVLTALRRLMPRNLTFATAENGRGIRVTEIELEATTDFLVGEREHQQQTLINALRVAGEQYRRDAEHSRSAGTIRIAEQFDKQKDEAMALADIIELRGQLATLPALDPVRAAIEQAIESRRPKP